MKHQRGGVHEGKHRSSWKRLMAAWSHAWLLLLLSPAILSAFVTFTEQFDNAPDFTNKWFVAGQGGTYSYTYTSGNFRIQAAPTFPVSYVQLRTLATFSGNVDFTAELNHQGYGRTQVGLWSTTVNDWAAWVDLDTDDTAILGFNSRGGGSTNYKYSSAPYMNRWITLRLKVVGATIEFYADGVLLETMAFPAQGECLQLEFGASSVSWKSGWNDTSFRLMTATGDPCPGTDQIAPVCSNVAASPNPVAVNTAATLTARVDDTTTGGSNIAAAEYSVNGGSWVPMSAADAAFDEVSEDVTAALPAFSATGIYTLCARGKDAAGNTGAPECILLPLYDPNGGFTTGGGSVQSPAGADLSNPSAAGPATFGFVSKYLPGRSTPDGNLEFQFHEGNLNFKSTSMDWLVVTAEPRSIFRGTGTVNGANVCKFEVDAWDGSFQPGNVDAFGLKIFSCDSGGDRYSLPARPLTKGSIIIHKQ